MTGVTVRREGPPQGHGHYDYGGQRWWDEQWGRWIAFSTDTDTLTIALEPVDSPSDGPPPTKGAAVEATEDTEYRFVGVAESVDRRWPTYRIVGRPFLIPTVDRGDDLPRLGVAGDLVDQRLTELHAELLKLGWEPEGRDGHWWAQRFTRPCLRWPHDQRA